VKALIAVAFTISVVLAVPDFREVVVPSGGVALTYRSRAGGLSRWVTINSK